MRWWGLEPVQQSAAKRYREAKEWWHSAFHSFCFELHASASSAFHNKQQSLLLCLGAKILPREHLVCPRIWCTRSSLLKTYAWTFSFLASQYASSARTAVLIQVWYGTPMSHFLSQYGSTCHLLPCYSASEMSKHMQHAVFCAPLWASWAPIVHTLSDNPNDYWQCQRVESLKSEESARTDRKLWYVCRHTLFCWPYAPNYHSPKMDTHFAPHRARSLVLHWTSEPIS